jgi:hypothetical protein
MYDLEFYKNIKLLLKTVIPTYETTINDIMKDDYVLQKRKKDLRFKNLNNLMVDRYMNMYIQNYLLYFNYDWYGKKYQNNIYNYMSKNNVIDSFTKKCKQIYKNESI